MKAHSHTSRQTWQSCKRLWHLKYNLRIEPDADPQGIRMGKAMAQALEQGSLDAALESLDKSYAEQLEKGERIDQLEVERVQLGVLVAEYLRRYGRPMGTKRELEFNHPVLGKGFLDAVYADENGDLIAIEDKLLNGSFWRTAEEEQLAIGAQVTAYFAAMRELGMPLKELRYRVTLKPTIKPNSRTGETLDEYAKRLRGRILADHSYAFREYQLSRTDQELDDFMQRAEGINEEIAWAARRKAKGMHVDRVYPPNLGSACTQFGKCSFMDMCRNKAMGMPSMNGYRVRPEKAKLTAKQRQALRVVQDCLHDQGVTASEAMAQGAASAYVLGQLVKLGMLEKRKAGRRTVYVLTDQGRSR